MPATQRRLPTKGVLFIRNLPPRLKELFRSVCVRRGETMTDVILILMKKYIEDPKQFRFRKTDIDDLYFNPKKVQP